MSKNHRIARKSLQIGLSDVELAKLEIAIGHKFADISLLRLATMHKSAGDGMAGFESNERLEWLGDRVLGLMSARHIYLNYPSIEEGGLTRLYNNIVNGTNCAEAARKIGLYKFMVVSKSIIDVKSNDNILGDAYEAVIGAIYLDAGMAQCQKLIDLAIECAKTGGSGNRNYKSLLQEWAQKRKFDSPLYEIINREGPDHAPNFLVRVTIGDKSAEAHGSSKQSAEQIAAQTLYERVSQYGL
jgi:ribonuclease III